MHSPGPLSQRIPTSRSSPASTTSSICRLPGTSARPGDRLCVTRLDRLGHSLRDLLETVDSLKAQGIHLVSLEERLDTSSASGELVFHVFGAIAHFERRLISERTRDGTPRFRPPFRPPLDPSRRLPYDPTCPASPGLIQRLERGLDPRNVY